MAKIQSAGKGKIFHIRKRNGTIEPFRAEKISAAVRKAFAAAGRKDFAFAGKISGEAVARANKLFVGRVPGVEQIQDIVEEVLVENNLPKVARAYILYRQKHKELREAREFFGIKADLKISVNAARVLERRYLLRDGKGKIIESPKELFRRVASAVAKPDAKYGGTQAVKKAGKEFFEAMANLDFVPNTPTLMNAETKLGQLSACFVLPVEDSIDSIFSAVKNMATIHQSGGGTGFSFSRLRPKGDIVMSTKGTATGPVSFMKVFDMTTEVIKQGGKRRGANMGILHVSHPDIVEFVTSKADRKALQNFNISVAATEEFMRKVKNNGTFRLVNPRTRKAVGRIKAGELFDLIATMAWETGDPGMIFIDEINWRNTAQKLGKIEATNPCGEQALLPYESCNLGSINLSHMAGNGKVDWEKLRRTVHIGVHFLDNVITANKFPLPQTEKITKANRRIGLGVMGFAEMLIKLGIRYDSSRAVRFAEKLMRFINSEARKKSAEIAAQRGSFPNFKKSNWRKMGFKRMRNVSLTTIAPTGTISIIAGCSSGIEPLFAVCFVRNVMEGTKLLEVNSEFERIGKERGFYSEKLMAKVARSGSVQRIKEIPADVHRLFVTAHDIKPEWHVRMQAAFQKNTDSAVSKTINFPENATAGDVRKAYLLAHKLKCKGITVYRYGSKEEQVLSLGSAGLRGAGEEYASAGAEYSGGCPIPYCPF